MYNSVHESSISFQTNIIHINLYLLQFGLFSLCKPIIKELVINLNVARYTFIFREITDHDVLDQVHAYLPYQLRCFCILFQRRRINFSTSSLALLSCFNAAVRIFTCSLPLHGTEIVNITWHILGKDTVHTLDNAVFGSSIIN